MINKNPANIEIQSSENVHYSIIWLHGLGADGSDFVPIVQELQIPKDIGIRFIFPHAPIRPVSINQGYAMRAWFDISSLSQPSTIDQEGIGQSIQTVAELIAEQEARGILAKHIFLAGFSQGGVIALATGLTYGKPLAGLMILSSYFPFHAATDKILSANNNKDIPIFLAHGRQDTILPINMGEHTLEVLQAAGLNVSWHTYDMAHSVCPAEIIDLRHWLMNLIKDK
jgi:phospholipase/carboxylesterase